MVALHGMCERSVPLTECAHDHAPFLILRLRASSQSGNKDGVEQDKSGDDVALAGPSLRRSAGARSTPPVPPPSEVP